jgi:hypothetical protein
MKGTIAVKDEERSDLIFFWYKMRGERNSKRLRYPIKKERRF